jgi:alpha-D-ribose 1-methylphosphonate 5-triphosphate synthase subunit PhnH
VAGLLPAAAAVLLTLADMDTPLWLDPAADTPQARAWLRFSCNAPLTADPGQAAFAVIGAARHPIDLGAFNPGSPEYPDRSATLILAVTSLEPDRGWALRGPGIPGARRLAVAGLDPGFARARAALEPLFPLGLDVIFAAPGALACLPRTARLEEAPCM